MNIGKIVFSVSASVAQTIELSEGYTMEQVLEGLNEGTYFTTLSSNNPMIVEYNDLDEEVIVAKIISTEADGSNNEYFDFLEED